MRRASRGLGRKRERATAIEGAFSYPVDACDVENRANLIRYREKAARWFEWLDGDPEHSISRQLSEMLEHDAVYRCLNECRRPPHGAQSASASGTLGRFLDRGYVSGQVLAISRLVDRTRDVVSLGRLLDELTDARPLLTREVFVSHDGLPYDWQSALGRNPLPTGEAVWVESQGPNGWGMSFGRHEEFDRLSGISPESRTRGDLLPQGVFDKLRAHLGGPSIVHMVSLRHKRIAHAATLTSRTDTATSLSMNLVADAHRRLLQVSQVIQGCLLFGSWRGGAIPVPQYDVFEHFELPLAGPEMPAELHRFWQLLSDERDGWLSDAMSVVKP